MELLTGWTGMILGFSGLIFVHELGHFLLAKWNGVQVNVFSIGMGPYLVSFTHNKTVYALSLIPLGGYVKMMGQDDMNADPGANKDPSDFRNKRPGQRAAILVAGAFFNIVLTLMIFTLCYYFGTYFPSTRISSIVPGKPLAKAVLVKKDEQGEMKTPANLKKGDVILEVNGVHVKSGMDLMVYVASTPRGEPLTLRVERQEGTPRIVYVSVMSEDDKKRGLPSIGLDSQYSEDVPLALGFSTERYFYLDKDPASDKDMKECAAAKSGKFKKGDRLLAIEDRSDPLHSIKTLIDQPETLIHAAGESNGKERIFIIEREGQSIEVPLTSIKDDNGDYKFGIRQSLIYRVSAIDANSEAFKAGLNMGMFVVGFEPENPLVRPWKKGRLLWTEKLNDEKPKSIAMQVPDFEAYHTHGVFYQLYSPPELFKSAGLTDALGTAWEDVKNYTVSMFSTIRGLFSGSINPKNLSGPVGIGRIIYTVSNGQTFLGYLWLLGYISLNLGVMQLLPIPLLDGFHLVLVLVEKLKGTPVSAKVQVACFYLGMVLIGLLFTFVMGHDIYNLFVH